MGHGQRFRRVVMLAAGVVLAISSAAWVTSLFRVHWASPIAPGRFGPPLRQTPNASLENGLAIFCNEQTTVSGWQAWGFSREHYWWPKSKFFYYVHPRNRGPRWGICIPLWIPAACSGLTLGGLLVIGRRGRALARKGHCPTCNYDLTGITGVCPECGMSVDASPRQRRGIAGARGAAPGPPPAERTKP
ncbi:MAG: hypothetical protein IT431_00885 [Phycisphaerales bacterium]|nr:hypothetical protein [Phycisphaerales bacterium]